MTKALQTAPTHLSYLTSRPGLPVAAQMAIGFAALVTKWSARKRSRRELAQLSPEQLWDIGLSREDAHYESTLPFWKP